MTTTEPNIGEPVDPGEPIQPDVNDPNAEPLFDPDNDNPDDGDDGDNLTGA
jgi:hypothetical protein